MIPRATVGTGITGSVRYLLGEGKDPKTGQNRTEPKGDHSRVAWLGGTGFGFEIKSQDDADLARRLMEFAALNQASKTRKCEKDCYHLSLSWRPGEEPTRAQMEEAAHQALAAIGMSNAQALFVSHNDEKYAHLHIVASKINPATGKAYDLKGDRILLSQWAQKYERDFSGGIVCTRREEANQLRDAIDRRDAPAVLALMVQQRATFKGSDLERVLAKQIKAPLERAQFAELVLRQPDAVHLAEAKDGRTARYTSRAVLESEGQVLNAAATLRASEAHWVSLAIRRDVLTLPQFAGISREQTEAMRHALDSSGLTLIDGQAGTGKSFAISAIRQAYERAGYSVIGLGPTNAVAADMRDNGFHHAATIHSELFKLNNGRTAWNNRTLVIMDEAAMIDTALMAQLMGRAEQAGAKLVLVGDDRQLSSIDRGGMFGVLKDRYGAAELTEVRRQHKNDDRRAAELMAEGNFSAALAMYDAKGAIHWTRNQDDALVALVDQWSKDSAADPTKSRFVIAYTNDDVDRLNAELRAVRKERGELTGPDRTFETKHGHAAFSAGDRIQITGTDKALGLTNGAIGTIQDIEGDKIAVQLHGKAGRRIEIDAGTFQDFRHGYAGTIYKGQGRTLDQTYLYHSEHWRSAASYVALTRHRDKAELFVATNTAKDLKELSRQMARVDDRRAASKFYQQGAPVAVPPIDLPTPDPARGPPFDWTDRGGMVPQQESALKSIQDARAIVEPKPRIRVQARTEPASAPQQTKPRYRVAAATSPVTPAPAARHAPEPVPPQQAPAPRPTPAIEARPPSPAPVLPSQPAAAPRPTLDPIPQHQARAAEPPPAPAAVPPVVAKPAAPQPSPDPQQARPRTAAARDALLPEHMRGLPTRETRPPQPQQRTATARDALLPEHMRGLPTRETPKPANEQKKPTPAPDKTAARSSDGDQAKDRPAREVTDAALMRQIKRDFATREKGDRDHGRDNDHTNSGGRGGRTRTRR